MLNAVAGVERDGASRAPLLEELRRPPDVVAFSARTTPGAVVPVWTFP